MTSRRQAVEGFMRARQILVAEFSTMTDIHQTQIAMAAAGCISGTLGEWPVLLAALDSLGFDVTEKTASDDARELCQFIMGEVRH